MLRDINTLGLIHIISQYTSERHLVWLHVYYLVLYQDEFLFPWHYSRKVKVANYMWLR